MTEDLDNFGGEELDFDELERDPVADLGVTREGDEDATGVILTALREPRGATDAPLNCRGRDRLEDLGLKRGIAEFLRARTAVAAAEVIVPKGATHKINKGDLEGEHFLLIKSIYGGKLIVGYIRGGKRNGREVRISPDDVLDLNGLAISPEAIAILIQAEIPDDEDEVVKPVVPEIVTPKIESKEPRIDKKKRKELNVPIAATHQVLVQGRFFNAYARIDRTVGQRARITIFFEGKKIDTEVKMGDLKKLDF